MSRKKSLSDSWIAPLDLSGKKIGTDPYSRHPYDKDFGSLVHSLKFRRLSFKTQVHLNPKNDFVRTRSTHSIEVSQIGVQLATHLASKLRNQSLESYESRHKRSFLTDLAGLTRNACLAHDLGQAPFGHKGESCLATFARSVGSSFEANRQTVRPLFQLANSGLPVSAQFIDAVMKYKSETAFGGKAPAYFLSEIPRAETVFMEITGTKEARHPVAHLMAAADDIAYLSGDLEDYLRRNQTDIPSELKKSLLKLGILKAEQRQLTTLDIENRNRLISKISDCLIKICIKQVCNAIEVAVKGKNLEDVPLILNAFSHKKCGPKRKFNLLYWEDSSGVGTVLQTLKSQLYGWILDSEIRKQEIEAEKILRGIWHYFIPVFEGKIELKGDLEKFVPTQMIRDLSDLPLCIYSGPRRGSKISITL